MAKIKLGAIVTQISGKLGGHIFARNRGGAYMRTNATPSNPQTQAQTAIRAILAALSTLWSGITDVQRDGWNNAVQNFSRTDQFGDIRNLSGKALFTSLNANSNLVGLATNLIAPLPMPVPAVVFTAAIGDIDAGTFLLTFGGDTTGSRLLVYATPTLSNGTSFVKNRLRKLMSVTGGAAGDTNIFTQYTAKYGSMGVDNNVHIGVVVINAVGQASPMTTVKAVFTEL